MFETIEHAKKAVTQHMFPRVKDGKMSRALPYNSYAVRNENGGKDIQSTSVFVKGFQSLNWNHSDLYSKFCEYGKIISCKVLTTLALQMDNYDLSAIGGAGSLSVLEYQGKKSIAYKKAYNNLYVKGFPPSDEFTEDDLTELFVDFGEIQNVAIMRDSQGKSKGFGFICFTDPTSAEKATQHVLKLSENCGEKQDD